MDTVFIIINGQEVYVADYYKQQVKAVTFKDKDFWEVYDSFDFQELIEYMNYPLNYNKFKGSKVVVLYAEPRSYEMLFENKKHFAQAEAFETGILKECIMKYCEKQNHFGHKESYYIVYEDTVYQVVQKNNDETYVVKCTVEMLNDIEESSFEKFNKVKTINLCEYFIEERITFSPFQERLIVLSPANLEQKYIPKRKQTFLETHFVMEKDSIKQNGYVEKGEKIFSYTQYVSKLFGHKKKQIMDKKAATQGYLYWTYCSDNDHESIWAEKGEILGVITQNKENEDNIIKWLKKIGF